METVDVKEFTKQLIFDKCSTLIESKDLLPDSVMPLMKRAHKEYTESPNEKTFNNIKELISTTKYVEESVEYKNFNRGIFLIAVDLILLKLQEAFPHYKPFFVNARKQLDKVNPDIRSSPKGLLHHYLECIDEMENPKSDDHYMVSFAKEIVTKIFYDTVADMTNMGGSAVVIASLSKDTVINKTVEGGATRKKLVTIKKVVPERKPLTTKKVYTVNPICMFS